MDKLKTFLELLKTKYSQNDSGDANKDLFIGAGSYAMVFDIDGAAYKITTESTFAKQQQLAEQNNFLHSLNINVPYTYCIHSYNDNLMFFDEIKNNAKAKRYSRFIQDIDQMIHAFQYQRHKSSRKFCGIFQEKIEGDSPFRPTPKYIGDAMCIDKGQLKMALENPRKANMDVLQTVKDVRNDLNEKLNYFLNIPDEHYKKFISDAFKINNQKICIDNVTKENFIYNKDKGFYFLDLGALEYKNFTAKEKQFLPLSCTIDNVLEQAFYPLVYFTDEQKRQYAQLYIKLHKCMADVYLQNLSDPTVTKTIKKYNSQHNEYGTLYYINLVKDLPVEQQQKFKKQLGYIESLFLGNALASAEELEN